jgi:hypothetical protein
MSLPICIVYWDMKQQDAELKYADVQRSLERKFHDYHVLVIPSSNTQEAMDIKVLNAKNMNRVTFNELKDMVIKAVENLKKPTENASNEIR